MVQDGFPCVAPGRGSFLRILESRQPVGAGLEKILSEEIPEVIRLKQIRNKDVPRPRKESGAEFSVSYEYNLDEDTKDQ